jgi:pyruvate dehydrogenase E2 component (dihydrolipoamide acetyltransferase)
MAVSVTMPQLGESVSEGTVTRWLKKEGDHVEADEPLLEVSTDKVDTEVPAPASGTLTKITVQEDETVEVGQELATIGEASDSGAAPAAAPPAEPAAEPAPAAPAAAPEPASAPPAAAAEPAVAAAPEPEPTPERESAQPAAAASPAPSQPTPPQPAPTASENGNPGAYVTPLVRKLAAEHGVDLNAVRGTGVGGRIRKQDVLDARTGSNGAVSAPASSTPAAASATAAPAASSQPATPARQTPAPVAQVRGRTEPLSRLRRVIATRMVDSLQTAAQLTTVVEADVTKIARLRQQAKSAFEAREGVKLSFLPFFALAAVESLKAHPKVNASIDLEAGTVTYHEAEHLGIAVDSERGLLVPVIHGAGDLNLGGIARKIADLAERTRSNNVSPDELGGGTFTLTNTGSRGALFDTPIINQPQVAILGTGTVVKRPVVVDDPALGEVIAVRSMVYLALTYDHRLVDGADAARFLVSIKDRLEEGDFEAELGL